VNEAPLPSNYILGTKRSKNSWNSLGVINPISNFRGLSYGQWSSIWCNWLLSEDPDEYRGGILFLRGNVNYGPVGGVKGAPRLIHPRDYYNRTGKKGKTVFVNTPIFFPVLNALMSKGDIYDGKLLGTESDLRSAANRDIEEGGLMWATVSNSPHGTPRNIVKNLNHYLIESPLFSLSIPKRSRLRNKMENATKFGIHPSVTVGYYILAIFLIPGTYRLQFGGYGKGEYRTDARYDIKIIPNQ
jgi:hypothetical protein